MPPRNSFLCTAGTRVAILDVEGHVSRGRRVTTASHHHRHQRSDTQITGPHRNSLVPSNFTAHIFKLLGFQYRRESIVLTRSHP
ncbi:hypothetical protein DY000_02042689 [Brassica cretica]|uniref:Uncharacterized protein n=1 Tax=Brassica cretica TaxID=69181 RepID=A0ABQ7BJA5_BRACR|nr:hypothetical protein DY000_02042689 [Brassica cretica]